MNILKSRMEKVSITLEDKLGRGLVSPQTLNITVNHILSQYLLRPGTHQVS